MDSREDYFNVSSTPLSAGSHPDRGSVGVDEASSRAKASLLRTLLDIVPLYHDQASEHLFSSTIVARQMHSLTLVPISLPRQILKLPKNRPFDRHAAQDDRGCGHGASACRALAYSRSYTVYQGRPPLLPSPPLSLSLSLSSSSFSSGCDPESLLSLS